MKNRPDSTGVMWLKMERLRQQVWSMERRWQ